LTLLQSSALLMATCHNGIELSRKLNFNEFIVRTLLSLSADETASATADAFNSEFGFRLGTYIHTSHSVPE
jgi:hypothetical protein